jgi:hypothetical protein
MLGNRLFGPGLFVALRLEPFEPEQFRIVEVRRPERCRFLIPKLCHLFSLVMEKVSSFDLTLRRRQVLVKWKGGPPHLHMVGPPSSIQELRPALSGPGSFVAP